MNGQPVVVDDYEGLKGEVFRRLQEGRRLVEGAVVREALCTVPRRGVQPDIFLNTNLISNFSHVEN